MNDVMAAVKKVAPKLAEISDGIIYDDVWERPNLSRRDRSLITIAALVALNLPLSIGPHVRRGLVNGLTKDEIAEVITHIAFYAGWPVAVSACQIAAEVFEGKDLHPEA